MISTKLFPLGQTVMTRCVAVEAQQNLKLNQFVVNSLSRHSNGDWGDVYKADGEMNDYALKHRERLVSVYRFDEGLIVPGESRIWIITEADRSSTTVLFPSDYKFLSTNAAISRLSTILNI